MRTWQTELIQEQKKSFELSSAQEKMKKEVDKWKSQAHFSAEDLKTAKALIKEAEADSLARGVSICIKSLFDALIGQQFLKTLHTFWMESYRKSINFLGSMGRFLVFVEHGMDLVIAQQSVSGFDETYDQELETLVKGLGTPPQFLGNLKEGADTSLVAGRHEAAVYDLLQTSVTPKDLVPLTPSLIPLHFTEVEPLQTLPQHRRIEMRVEGPVAMWGGYC